MSSSILWLKDDLRLEDNRAFLAALKTNLKAIVHIDDPLDGSVNKTLRRRAHERSALDLIQDLVEPVGIQVLRAKGSSEAALAAIAAQFSAQTIHASRQVGDATGHARDLRAARALRAGGYAFVEHDSDGIARGSRPVPAPFITGATELSPVRFRTRTPGMQAMDEWLKRLPTCHYRRDMWLPIESATACSRMSIALASGTLSTDRAFDMTRRAARAAPHWQSKAFQQYEARLHWRRSFIQNFENGIKAFPWGPTRTERPEDAARMDAWLSGRTGVPLVDAAMLDLTENGWINFRLRQVLCSFAIDILDLDMHLVGEALGRLFDDYEPGIHWCQIGLQAGMAAGRGPRVINPVKQSRELDPGEAYIRRWNPKLSTLAPGAAHEPWLDSDWQGPVPIVDLKAAAAEARARPPIHLRVAA